MRQPYGLDKLSDYPTEKIPDHIAIINPAHRALESQVRRACAKLSRLRATFGALNREQAIEPQLVEDFTAKKAEQPTAIEAIEIQVAALKGKWKETPRKIPVKDLPESERFQSVSHLSQHFLDTIKRVAYRAETAMVNIIRPFLSKPDEARTWLRILYQSEVDLLVDESHQTLTVCLHHSPWAHTDEIIRTLCDELTATKTEFPRTNLGLVFVLGSNQNPRDQEV